MTLLLIRFVTDSLQKFVGLIGSASPSMYFTDKSRLCKPGCYCIIIGSFYYVTGKGGSLQIFWGLKIKGMVERSCKKSAQLTLRPPCCRIHFDANRVKKL